LGLKKNLWVVKVRWKFGYNQKFLEVQKPFYKKVFGRRRQVLWQDGRNDRLFGCSLAHPAGVRLGIDRTQRLHARPVRRYLNSNGLLACPFKVG